MDTTFRLLFRRVGLQGKKYNIIMRLVRKTRYFFRFKYRKGHNIHSPFVFNLVREVFMPQTSKELTIDNQLYEQFHTENVKSRHAKRWCQLYDYMKLQSYCVDPSTYNNEELVVVTSIHCVKSLNTIVQDMAQTEGRVVMIVNGINKNQDSRNWWAKEVKNQVVLDFNSFGVIVFDKLLSEKTYKLKL